jgi:hypothetical protein
MPKGELATRLATSASVTSIFQAFHLQRINKSRKRKMSCRTLRQPIKYLVPEAGIEPARSEEQGILSIRNRSTFTIRYQKQLKVIKEMSTHEFS